MKQHQLPKLSSKSIKQISLAIFVLLVAVIGSVLIKSYAGSQNVSLELEDATTTGNIIKCPDQTASAGGFVKYGVTTCQTAFTNPVKLSTADPGVLKWDNRYYMVSTSGVPSFQIYYSDNLVTWRASGASVFNGSHPWGIDRFWAPEIHRVGNRFAVYYSAGSSTGLDVGVATADNILGPYTDLGQPLISETFGVIDVNFFRNDDGRQYLYWKEDTGNTRIFAQEVNQAGTTLIGPRNVVLQKGLAWEGSKGIEASWVMKKNGTYYMFYSGELYSSTLYAIGVASSSSPIGTFTKKGDPILRSSNRWKGPGHNSVVQVGASDYMVYHAWDSNAGVGDRVGLVDKITWVGSWPTVGTGVPTESTQPNPQ